VPIQFVGAVITTGAVVGNNLYARKRITAPPLAAAVGGRTTAVETPVTRDEHPGSVSARTAGSTLVVGDTTG
jgi:hypothetical protein